MRKHNVLYFSTNPRHIEDFDDWAEGRCRLIKWYKRQSGLFKWFNSPSINVDDLPKIIDKQADLDSLSVIIDYKSFGEEGEALYYANEVLQRTILQYPEVDFLFDQSGKKENRPMAIDSLFKDRVVEEHKTQEFAKCVVQAFHVFRRENGFVLTELDYDNLFDGSNLRYAIKKLYYERLNATENFSELQDARRSNPAIIIDDESRQGRFNGYALYASGYRVIPVHTARMLIVLNKCVQSKIELLTPKIIIRDFDLQFPDVRELQDYVGFKFKHVPVIIYNANKTNVLEISVPKTEKSEEYVSTPIVEKYDEMIDYIRGYHQNQEDKKWFISEDIDTLFWTKDFKKISTYVITNGYEMLDIKSTNYKDWKINENTDRLEVNGMQKPISGLYYPFFTKLKNEQGEAIIRKNFDDISYKEEIGRNNIEKYLINKKRKNANHGVPLDIYTTGNEMLCRAEKYYQEGKYIKAAVLSQEIMELLNGFHYQMMIKVYQIKTKAENAIAMDVIGADERRLVLDAEERIKIIKNDIHRIVYSQYVGNAHNWIADIIVQLQRRKKEHELLGHIFSDCRDTCRDNEYFDVESIFLREMAHIDERDIGIMDIYRYLRHLYFMCKTNNIDKTK